MTDEIISVRIDKKLKEMMRMYDYLNWSAIIRAAIKEQLNKQQEEYKIDLKKAQKAAKMIDKLRESGAFSKGKTSTEIIREWRNKRK